MKLTKQGIRDLGGNRRNRARESEFTVTLQTYTVTVGEDGYGGMYLQIETTSPRAAYRRAQELLRNTNTPTWKILMIARAGRLYYDHMRGWL